MNSRHAVILPLLAWMMTANPAAAAEKRSLGIEGVTEHFDVSYLPEWRYTGAEGERGDVEMKLDLYLPAGDGAKPLVIYVHGGGYGGGSKKVGGDNRQFVTRLLEEGFAVASMNYILHPKGIFPQAWWDFQDAARFLRKHSGAYRIDPLRIGAYGLSAGGWVISSATAGNGDLLRTHNGGAISASELREKGWKFRGDEPGESDNWLRPMRNPSPSWKGIHGGISAASFDFDHHMGYVRPYNPIYQKWVGLEYTAKYWDALVANGAGDRLEYARLTNPRFRGKYVHVPPFYSSDPVGSERNKAVALLGDSVVPLGEVVLDFFRRHLVEECRLPAPEIYPIPRVFEKGIEVSMVAPPGAVIHFTTDGTEPTKSSPTYSKPIPISEDAVVKAFAVRDGFGASGTNAAHFVKGTPAPMITGPGILPKGKTGEPYEVVFETDRADARWLIQGELVPHIPWKETNLAYPNNMAFDGVTGTWSGTPFRPGKYWIQIWVNSGGGTMASHRDYIWEVTGEKMPGESWVEKATEGDTNFEFARLSYKDGWEKFGIKELHKRFRFRGIKYHLAGEGDEERTLIVERGDADTARSAMEEILDRFGKLIPKTVWLDDLEK